MTHQKKGRKPAKSKSNQELLNRLAENIARSLDSFTAADMEYEALSVMIPTDDIKAIYESAGWDYIPTHGAKYKTTEPETAYCPECRFHRPINHIHD